PHTTSCHCRDLRSFPTRRSSDLGRRGLSLRLHRLLSPVLGKHTAAVLRRGGENNPRPPRGATPLPVSTPARSRRPQNPGLWKTADRKSTRLNSSHVKSSYAVFCL